MFSKTHQGQVGALSFPSAMNGRHESENAQSWFVWLENRNHPDPWAFPVDNQELLHQPRQLGHFHPAHSLSGWYYAKVQPLLFILNMNCSCLIKLWTRTPILMSILEFFFKKFKDEIPKVRYYHSEKLKERREWTWDIMKPVQEIKGRWKDVFTGPTTLHSTL